MLKILQARLQQYMNQELPDVQKGFRKGRGTWDQIASVHWIMEKARGFQKNIYFCFIDYAKAFDYVDHNEVWKILKEMGIPDHLTCLLRNLNTGQDTTVRTRHGTKPLVQNWERKTSCILSVHSFNFCAECIMWNAVLDEWQAGINQQPQICRLYHFKGWKWRRTKEPLDEGERGEGKADLKLNFQNN